MPALPVNTQSPPNPPAHTQFSISSEFVPQPIQPLNYGPLPADFLIAITRYDGRGDARYEAQIDANGGVAYKGYRKVQMLGTHTFRIGLGDVGRLWELVNIIGFFTLPSRLEQVGLKHVSAVEVTVSAGHITKTVVSRWGGHIERLKDPESQPVTAFVAIDMLCREVESRCSVNALAFGYANNPNVYK